MPDHRVSNDEKRTQDRKNYLRASGKALYYLFQGKGGRQFKYPSAFSTVEERVLALVVAKKFKNVPETAKCFLCGKSGHKPWECVLADVEPILWDRYRDYAVTKPDLPSESRLVVSGQNSVEEEKGLERLGVPEEEKEKLTEEILVLGDALAAAKAP